jgi:hypothetical protein
MLPELMAVACIEGKGGQRVISHPLLPARVCECLCVHVDTVVTTRPAGFAHTGQATLHSTCFHLLNVVDGAIGAVIQQQPVGTRITGVFIWVTIHRVNIVLVR